MGRSLNKLSARAVATIAKPGRHSDGGGLYLVVDKAGARRWAFLFRWEGRLREMGLGSLQGVPLARARSLASQHREDLAAGVNPIEKRRAVRTVPTFGEFADDLIKELRPGWKNAKHAAQWEMTLREYAKPLRPRRIDQVTTDHVLEALRPIWTAKPETAARLRGRIEVVLDAARARGLRSGPNPAGWRGHLQHLLPERRRLYRGHHPAMPYPDVPAFMARLAERDDVSALALQFLILTATRSSETMGARWSEIDLEAGVWTIPAERMKAKREHRVPLSGAALAILTEAAKLRTGALVFPGAKADRPLSSMALAMLLRRANVEGATAHGFRSSFRDWAGEETSFPRDVAEAALAHVVGDQTERAYRRGDALEKRRALMEAWASFCTEGAKVVHLVGAGRQ